MLSSSTMELPLHKNKSWISLLHASIGKLDQDQQGALLKPCGEGCAADVIALAERFLGIRISSIEHLITGWNMIREKRGLTGQWQYEKNTIRGVFMECGCPLVRSGLMELHPVQCYCSQGMMETIFSRVAGRPIPVMIKRTIGRGDQACEFVVQL